MNSDGPAGAPWIIGGGVVGGLGLAAVVTGVMLLFLDEQPVRLRCTGDHVDFRGVCRHRYNTGLGGILSVVAGTLGVGGSIALVVKGRRVSVRARGDRRGASVGVGLRF